MYPSRQKSRVIIGLQNAVKRPGVRVLLVFFATLLLVLQWGRWNYYRDPLSIFFDESRAYTRWYSVLREQQARQFIDATSQAVAAGTGDEPVKAGPEPRICASFTTVSRNVEQQYVEV